MKNKIKKPVSISSPQIEKNKNYLSLSKCNIDNKETNKKQHQ